MGRRCSRLMRAGRRSGTEQPRRGTNLLRVGSDTLRGRQPPGSGPDRRSQTAGGHTPVNSQRNRQ